VSGQRPHRRAKSDRFWIARGVVKAQPVVGTSAEIHNP